MNQFVFWIRQICNPAKQATVKWDELGIFRSRGMVSEMIEIRYSINEIELSGTIHELNEIRQAIEGAGSNRSNDLCFAANTEIDPSSFKSVGKMLIVRISTGPTKVSVDAGSKLLVEGSLENIEAFASFLSFDEPVLSGDHAHYEYYEENDDVAPNSTPLVIGVKDN